MIVLRSRGVALGFWAFRAQRAEPAGGHPTLLLGTSVNGGAWPQTTCAQDGGVLALSRQAPLRPPQKGTKKVCFSKYEPPMAGFRLASPKTIPNWTDLVAHTLLAASR